MKNVGKITLAYKWFLLEFSDGQSEGEQLLALEEKLEECLVSIEPQSGEIPPGQEQIISVKFSPVDVVNVSYKFRCK